ncbi:enoyl-CoA hydratase [Mycobacterium paraffinicum]|uniref:Enoyl-CoA hydratase n=1 Tax=Mycobacterium paraffinicum TaxID=53378 RepID=A0A1Q4I2C4_9MYCO|nr:enoyl-CoA hydratase/isomerase family protein [Mycobacterium paraffinicum]OJZ76132.1 enoyl-CoA hydratase [Mycobacterium paraffinicum]
MSTDYQTIQYAAADGVATVTLNRPDRLNAFNQLMCEEVHAVWQRVRDDNGIRAVILRAAGDRAFCSGVDMKEGVPLSTNPWHRRDPGDLLRPKANGVFKPIVAAVRGMAAGGAFYLLGEADLIICEPGARFFDPHVSVGLAAVLEPILLTRRLPLGEVLKLALMGSDERMTADRARELGLVAEIVESDELEDRANKIAMTLASLDPLAVQGTVRAIWESLDRGRTAALDAALPYTVLGNLNSPMAPRPEA